MKTILCALLVTGCTGADCATLAARYAEAFHEAQRCDPGRDACTGYASSVSFDHLADGTVQISIDPCANSCGGANVNPNRAGNLESLLREYREACEHPAGCMCPQTPDGGWPAYTCKPAPEGGGICSP